MKKHYLMVLVLVYFGVVSAQFPNAGRIPNNCSPKSKNPICWENQDHNPYPRPSVCLDRSTCHIIKKVQQDNLGNFHCQSITGVNFSCNKLVEKVSSFLRGQAVKVITPYFDGCHIPGGCSSLACVPGYGYAELDPLCKLGF
jgi:hypothetical protein